jgi:hypothetical protein
MTLKPMDVYEGGLAVNHQCYIVPLHRHTWLSATLKTQRQCLVSIADVNGPEAKGPWRSEH